MTTASFCKKVFDFHKKHGRDFPWRPPSLKLRRGRLDAYTILVSEVMLQQTQTFRVVPKYQAFLKRFPTIAALANAPLSDVLRLWQGLGYNRRALMLHRAARAAMRAHSGQVPQTYDELLALPGVGPYTAAAVMVFAYNEMPVNNSGEMQIMIETNIRSAIIHEWFPRRHSVTDRDVSRVLHQILFPGKPSPRTPYPFACHGAQRGMGGRRRKVRGGAAKDLRTFYYALMDYGAFLKQKYPNPSRRSAHHSRQSRFEGSDRQIRGHILRELTHRGGRTEAQLRMGTRERFGSAMKALIREGLVARRGKKYAIPV